MKKIIAITYIMLLFVSSVAYCDEGESFYVLTSDVENSIKEAGVTLPSKTELETQLNDSTNEVLSSFLELKEKVQGKIFEALQKSTNEIVLIGKQKGISNIRVKFKINKIFLNKTRGFGDLKLYGNCDVEYTVSSIIDSETNTYGKMLPTILFYDESSNKILITFKPEKNDLMINEQEED